MMTDVVATTDHRVIRSWVESRDGQPVKAGRHILRINFGESEAGFQPIRMSATDKPDSSGQERVEAQLDDPTVRYLIENTDLSPLQAQELIRQQGHDRAKLLELAKSMKAEG